MNIPQSMTAGDTVRWTENIVVLPGISYKTVFVSSGKTPLEVIGSIGDDTVSFELTAEQSLALGPGEKCAYLVAYEDSGRLTLGKCNVTVNPDPLSVAGADTRSRVKRILDDIDAVIEDRATDAVLDRSVDGMTFRYMSLDKLFELRDRYAALYAMEQGGMIDLPESVNLSLRGVHEH